MATRMRPPYQRGTSGRSLLSSGDRTEALLRAREAAAKAASLRELGDEFGAVVAEMKARMWLREFAMLAHRLPDGAANQDCSDT